MRFMLAVAVGACFACAALAEPVPVDVTKFELSGVRLYMSPDEAIKALKEKYGKNIKLSTSTGPSLLHPEKQEVVRISYTEKNTSVSVELASRMPGEAGSDRLVVLVRYTINSTSPTDRDQLMQMALDKYSTPTWGPEFHHAQWCGPVFKLAWPGAHQCDVRVPVLSVYAQEISLSDLSYADRVMAFKNQMSTVKPKF